MSEHAQTTAWLARLAAGSRSPLRFLRYNASQVFAGKFIYFLIVSVVLCVGVSLIVLMSSETLPTAENVYNVLLLPAVLLVFYPSAYIIQGDADARMVETLFGIPDYRYKVWLVRSLTQYLVIAGILLLLGILCRLMLVGFALGPMLFHLLFPVIFMGSLGFMMAAITRSGNSTAVIMVVVILVFWIGYDEWQGSIWSLFHNPFAQVEPLEALLWARKTLYNRIYLFTGAVIATMFGLLRLQHREKFI